MKLEQILQQYQMPKAIHNAAVICLQSTEYPLLFCRAFIRFISTQCNMPIIPQEMDAEHISHVMALLQTTFLGQSSWYWLHADALLSKSASDSWDAFLRDYKGPNKIIFCSTKPLTKPPSSWFVIQLPSCVDQSLFADIMVMLGIQQSLFGNHLFKVVQKLSLDNAVMLASYAQILGKNTQTFFTTWLPHLIIPETSLFSLSQALFARKSKQFFALWKTMSAMYPVQFWISFWSEQFWRAYCYIRLQKAGKPLEAKKIGYRLPFLFLNNLWRNYSMAELQQTHAKLYEIDFYLKQGGNEDRIELLYAQFLNKLM
jgi:hypothetical protein